MTTAPVAEPLRLSPSRISLYQQCPLRYRYRYLEKLPDPGSPATVRGTLVHAVLERLFDYPPAGRTPVAAHALVNPEWRKLTTADRDTRAVLATDPDTEAVIIDAAHDLIDRWYEIEDPTRLQPAAREIELETAITPTVLLHGIIDRLDIAPDGRVRINDYKTGKRPHPGYHYGPLQQLLLYALMHWRSTGVLPTQVRLIYPADAATIEDTPTADGLARLERKVVDIAGRITHSTETGEWPAKPSKLCGWCPYAALCPDALIYEGTPNAAPKGP